MSFRGAVRRALADPLGGRLARHFAIPAVTAIVADAGFGEPERIALAELAEAMARAGVPRGRLFVLLAGAGAPDPGLRPRAKELRDLLGVPVLPHDPAKAAFEAGRLEDGLPLAFDDELREAEAVVACGRFGAGRDGSLHGGPAALLPGLASAATRAALAERLGAIADPAARARAACAAALGALAHVPVDFALVWDDGDPPAVRAGEARAVFEACVAEGWLGPDAAAGLNSRRSAP